MNLLPLAENQTYDPNELSIEVSDIWNFERFQLHTIPSYDKDFAVQLLDKIGNVILAKSTPEFVYHLENEEASSQYSMLKTYDYSYNNIKDRFALDYFFYQDKYYSYYRKIVFTPSDDDFMYWFSLKLRQYDLSLEKVNEFLNFQLKRCSTKRGTNFMEMLNLSLLQYPDFFSDRLLQTVNAWINKNKKEVVSLNVAQTYNVLQGSKNKPSRPFPKLTWKENENKEKQLQNLHSMLESKGYIEKIELTNFKKHFNGYLENVPKINWLSSQYGLIYLMNELKIYLNGELYKGKNGSIAIAYFEKHFHYKGKAIETSSWRKAKSENQGVKNDITQFIDHIIKHL